MIILFSAAMDSERFARINRVYWESFGPSYLGVFLDETPPKTGRVLWYLKRRVAQVFVFIFFPIFIAFQIWGIVSRDSHNLMSISFDISFVCHNVQNFAKMTSWLTRLPTVRSLCLDFSKFHIAKHRPFLTSWVLEKESRTTRKLVGLCYMISYANVVLWFIVPTVTSVGKYVLYLIGSADLQPTYIPRYSLCRYPFDMSSLMFNRILVAALEIPVATLGVVYFQPIDMFLASAINMAQAQFRALNSALFTMPEELETFWETSIPVNDNPKRMDMRLFIEDHQTMIRYGIKLRKFLNPILGLVTFNCVTVICNMSIVASVQFEADVPLPKLLLSVTASFLVVVTCLVVFYLFTSMTGVLKDAEESVFQAIYESDWFIRDAKFRKNLMFMQQQSITAKTIKTCGIGDMGRSTFIDGLRMIYSYYNFMQRFR